MNRLKHACVLSALLGMLVVAQPAHAASLATSPQRVIDTPTRLLIEWHDTKGVLQAIDVTVTFKATVYTQPATGAAPMGVTWGGPPPRAAGCTMAQFNYTRYSTLGISVVYKTHMTLYWCFYGDHIASTTHTHGDLHQNWWFSSLTPGSNPFGSVTTQQWWNPFAGRAYDSSSYIHMQQGWHQCVPAVCIDTEYPFIWVSALGNGQFYWNAGH